MNKITPEIESEAAIYAAGTNYTKADIIAAYRQHGDEIDIQRFCEDVLGIASDANYSIAFMSTDGSFDIVQAFTAGNDDAANEYAEQNYAGQEWYVLDANGRNINGGAR